MWPLLLDMTKDESIQYLRNLELEAYSQLVSALRAQGPLNPDKRKLLKETSYVLNITQERHKAEVRRAISDEKLNTIAYHITGHYESLEDWAQEGRRLVPLLPRTAPQTAFTAIADEAAETALQCNKQLPLPSNTERKRQTVAQMPPSVVPETSKTLPFRIPDPPKIDESKKRKLQFCTDNSNLAQPLLAPKFCRIQQLYRQRSKLKTKDIHKKTEQDQLEQIQHHRIVQPAQQQTVICSTPPSHFAGPKVNVLQNISLQPVRDETIHQEENTKSSEQQVSNQPACSNENEAPRPKLITNLKPNVTLKQISPQPAGPSSELPKSIKVCSGKKSISKTVSAGQKLIVVSNAQTIPSNSILQRTLQIPFVKNVSIKNFEKFKIVTNSTTPTSIQVTNVTNSAVNPVRHKLVTVKTNSASKKVIPLSQLQVLNSKGSIKVLPLGGKIVGKSPGGASSLYITQPFTKNSANSQIISANKIQSGEEIKNNSLESSIDSYGRRENGKSNVLEDILKASGVISEESIAIEDYDKKIEEFHIPQIKHADVNCEETEMKIGKEGYIKSEEVQNYDYSLLPQRITEASLQSTEFTQEYEKFDVVTSEVIEAENSLVQLKELVNESELMDMSCEKVPEIVQEHNSEMNGMETN